MQVRIISRVNCLKTHFVDQALTIVTCCSFFLQTNSGFLNKLTPNWTIGTKRSITYSLLWQVMTSSDERTIIMSFISTMLTFIRITRNYSNIWIFACCLWPFLILWLPASALRRMHAACVRPRLLIWWQNAWMMTNDAESRQNHIVKWVEVVKFRFLRFPCNGDL